MVIFLKIKEYKMKTNPAWYFTEKQIGVDYLDSKIAEDYDNQHQSFRNFEAEAKDMVEKLKITKEDVVLDFGCGTGAIALNLARYCKKVICVDISSRNAGYFKNKGHKRGYKEY